MTGYNEGTITNCHAVGSAFNSISNSGDTFVGGFVGYNDGTISHCTVWASTQVSSGGSYIGGFVLVNIGVITDCHATVKTLTSGTAGLYTDGFAGQNFGTITWSSSTGVGTAATITGRTYVGGFHRLWLWHCRVLLN